MEIIWTKHAEQRLKEWEKKLTIGKKEIEDILKNPHQTVAGDLDAFVAQFKLNDGLLRIPFKYIEKDIKILTIYWTSKIDKYWKE
ncbi:MAG: DUF4258 domain-containing protein [bacterium]